jgi:glycosidase
MAPDGKVADGIDGFRLDVADHIGMKFWRDYRVFVKNINPEAYLVGEIWWERFPDRFMNPVPYVSGDVFDGIMFYQVYRPAKYFFSKSNFSINAKQLRDSLQYQWNRIPKPYRYSMMNVSATHDSPRLLTCFNNPGKYKSNAKLADDTTYKVGKPDGETFKRAQIYLIHQFTSIGAPHIWNGDELGMWGADDPDCRKPIWWPEMRFDTEKVVGEDGRIRYSTQVFPNKAILRFYTTLIKIRKENKVLSSGDIKFLEMEGKVISYKRFDENSEIIVCLNAGMTSYRFKIGNATYIDLMTKKTITADSLEVKPLAGVILRKTK